MYTAKRASREIQVKIFTWISREAHLAVYRFICSATFMVYLCSQIYVRYNDPVGQYKPPLGHVSYQVLGRSWQIEFDWQSTEYSVYRIKK
jgi:hypothetical protein